MKKKVLSVLLAGTLGVSLLAGCGSDSGSGSGSDGASSGEAVATEIDMDEDTYTVAMQLVVLPGTDYSALEPKMEAAINEITEPAINCDIDIQFVWISEIANTTSLGIAGDEKLDLIHVATVSPLSSMVGSDMLYDMNEGDLLQTRGTKLVELFGDLLEAGNVDGQQLAIPAKVFNASSKGIDYNKTVADAAGITIPESGDFYDLDEAFHQLAEYTTDVIGWYPGEGNNNYLYWTRGYENFGTNASYGAIMDSEKDLTVENIYETEEFKEYCLQMFRWRQDGIVQKDSTDATPAQDYFNAQQLFCYPGDLTPQLDANYGASAKNNGFELGTYETVGPKITNATVIEYMWGIAVNSERPDKAMDMLNFIYSNADVANILMYGLEGENYNFVDGSDRVIETNGSYIASFVQAGDTHELLIQSPAGEDYVEQWEALEKEATVSPILGYMFNDAEYQTESAAITNVISQYEPTLMNGSFDSEDQVLAYIDEFNAALEAAGINDVIAGNQEQLDAYLASH